MNGTDKVLILGSGGREHALAHAILKAPQVGTVYVWPGNEGMALSEGLEIFKADKNSKLEYLCHLAKLYQIDLTIIGEESYSYQGAYDLFQAHGLNIIGTNKISSKMESSKIYAKNILQISRVPTPDFLGPFSYDELKSFLKDQVRFDYRQWVIKADGPCLGKGVWLPNNDEELLLALDYLNQLEHQTFFLEKRLIGQEISAFALISEENILYLGDATDYKRAFDQDKGPNTGGMGAVSPSPHIQETQRQKIMEYFKDITHTFKLMDLPYEGVLFLGLLKTETDQIYTLECNVRFGDPETQALSLRWPISLYSTLKNWARKQFEQTLEINNDWAIHVVLAHPQYPFINKNSAPQIELPSSQIKYLNNHATLISSGLESLGDQSGYSSRGRILGLSTISKSLSKAREQLYQLLNSLEPLNIRFRRDIGIEKFQLKNTKENSCHY